MSEHIYDLAITGNILQRDRFLDDATLLVKNGKIGGITIEAAECAAKKHIQAQGKMILPGAIDSHVHSLSNPREGFEHATISACAGGVTTIVDMPMDVPAGIATPEAFDAKRELIGKESYVDVALLALVKNNSIDQIAKLKERGCCGYKLSLFDTDPDRFPRVKDGHLLKAFGAIAQTGLTAGVHAENDEIIKFLIRESIEEGKTYPLAHYETRPEVSETESVLKGLEIAKAAGVRFHLYHISCSRSIDLANYYRMDGCSVSIETCPHYLIFSTEDMDRLGGRIRINPPVREPIENERLWHKLETGQIDCVSSDHAPWPAETKEHSSIFDNPSGCPGVETLLPLLFSEGVSKKRISIGTLVRVLMENPAKISGLYPQKGTLDPGSDADIIIFDPLAKWTVKGKNLHSKAGWTPYEGIEITGKVHMTIVRGKVVYEEGEITGIKGYGKFIAPNKWLSDAPPDQTQSRINPKRAK